MLLVATTVTGALYAVLPLTPKRLSILSDVTSAAPECDRIRHAFYTFSGVGWLILPQHGLSAWVSHERETHRLREHLPDDRHRTERHSLVDHKFIGDVAVIRRLKLFAEDYPEVAYTVLAFVAFTIFCLVVLALSTTEAEAAYLAQPTARLTAPAIRANDCASLEIVEAELPREG
jgi:hypothetical protein